ncbi:Protein CBG10278 [Caenorhabditis briggsae]|nr:Protein CBG10278 [Caenorhabditis briggsae]CAP29715.2 Protein CBG10278 [Caenorhabditis briggsae]
MAVQHGIKIDNQVHVQPTATSCPVNKCSKSSKNFEDAAVQTDYSNIDYEFSFAKFPKCPPCICHYGQAPEKSITAEFPTKISERPGTRNRKVDAIEKAEPVLVGQTILV